MPSCFGIPKSTHYKHIGVLVNRCIIEELAPGGHGKKAEYDLEAWKYKLDFDGMSLAGA